MNTTRDQVKAALLRQLEVKVDALLDWAEAHPQADPADIEGYWQQTSSDVRAALNREMLYSALTQPSCQPPDCEWCGQKKESGRRIASRWGEIELEQKCYWCPRCGTGTFPPG